MKRTDDGARGRMPIGIQDFEKLRDFNCAYIDKTEYVWRLVNEPAPCFLSRPRRFGKSLLLTTIKAYFLGKRELFDGLAIAEFETEWRTYPVLHFDFNPSRYDSVESLDVFVSYCLESMEREYGLPSADRPIEIRFRHLIDGLREKTGLRVVVLIDEYDKPLLESMDDEKLNAELRAALKPFFGVLKSADTALRFVMMTGVTRFSKVSIFSDLNQLKELSLSKEYAAVCGITEPEMLGNFVPELEALAKERGESFEKTVNEVRRNFNGYRFANNGESVYNPFSLLNTLDCREIKYYWFATGTPTFLFAEMERTNFDINSFNGDIAASETMINSYQPGGANPVPLLYQSGYLTITGFDAASRRYRLGFPNEEVRYGLLNDFLPRYIRSDPDKTGFYVGRLSDAFEEGDLDAFFTRLKAFFSAIPYDLCFEKGEKYYQTIFYLVFTLMGQFIETEVRSAAGRADAVVKTRGTIYVFEFKLDNSGTAADALKQMDDKGYLIPYGADGRRLVKAGVVFDTEKRTIAEWAVSEAV
jgi:hypothetical protein